MKTLNELIEEQGKKFDEFREKRGGWPSRTECFEEFFVPALKEIALQSIEACEVEEKKGIETIYIDGEDISYLCKECGGEYLCHHGRVKRQCKLCGGASICVHMRRISLCRECGGSALCEHGRQKRQCKLCQVTTGVCLCCAVSSFDCN